MFDGGDLSLLLGAKPGESHYRDHFVGWTGIVLSELLDLSLLILSLFLPVLFDLLFLRRDNKIDLVNKLDT